MKKIILLSVLLIFAGQVSAQETQTYLPVFSNDDTKIYFMTHRVIDGDYNDPCYGIMHTIVKKDTIDNFYIGNAGGTFGGYFDRIKISDDNSKMWGYFINYYSGDTVFSQLLMDLNLNIGDEYVYFDDTLTVSDVYEQEGRKHIIFNKIFYNPFPVEEEYWYVNFSWIEGIGPNIYFYGEDWVMAGFNGNELKYKFSEWNSYNYCYTELTQVNNVPKRNMLHIFPSVASDIIHIKVDTDLVNSNCMLIINDMFGRIIKNIDITENVTYINISDLSAGLYIITFNNSIAKFIKK
jgi:hypothetical protein